MIDVILVTNDGNGMPQSYKVRDDACVGDLLSVAFDGNIDDYTIQVRPAGGASGEADEDTALTNGCRVTLAPRKVEGA